MLWAARRSPRSPASRRPPPGPPATRQDAVVVDDGDISDWLDEADQLERVRRLSDPETRQLRLDETDQVKLQRAIEERAKRKAAGEEAEPLVKRRRRLVGRGKPRKPRQPKKKVPGKLPPRPEKATKDSQEAASDMLKKFFNKRSSRPPVVAAFANADSLDIRPHAMPTLSGDRETLAAACGYGYLEQPGFVPCPTPSVN